MPLILFKCKDCENLMEKFFHKIGDLSEEEIECDECGGTDCVRQFTPHKSRVRLDARANYNERIKPDAERIMKKMKKGGNKEFFDIYGEK